MKNIEDIYPLSPVQQGMLFHTLYAPKAGMYLEQKFCTLHGNLDVSAFQSAWLHVVERHPVLRTAFIWKDLDEPLQVVRQRVKLSWEQYDWRGLLPDGQQERLRAFLKADRARGMELSRAPLMRLALCRLAEEAYQFVWTHHHILVDGWSLPLIFKEVIAFYDAFRQGQDLHLPRSRPYRDYIAWLQQQDLSRAEAFWREELAGFTAPTPLGMARQADSLPAREETYGEQQIMLPVEEMRALQSLARQHQLTMNTLAQGAWGLLLSHYSGEKDVVFGATVSGRPAELLGIESMVGLFINTLPVRVKMAPEASLLSWLAQLQSRQVDMRQYEYSPLAQVQGWSRVPRGLPLFESILVYDNYPVDFAAPAPGRSLEIRNVGARERGNYLLLVKVRVAPGVGLLLGTLYDGRRFDDATIACMLEHLQTLLRSMAAHPHIRLGELEDLLIEAEKRGRIMEKGRRKEINLTNFMNINPKVVNLSQRELIKTDYLQPGATFPLVVQPAVDNVDLLDWAKGNLDFIEEELSKHGSILFRGFGVDSIDAFENFARTIRPELYGEYGDLPREGVSGNVYQSTPYPADKTILFHNESSHMNRWPLKQWFYCVKAAQEGGETPIVDCRKVYQCLDPQIIESFRQKKLMYVRNFVEGLDVGWQSFFHTTDKSVVEEYCRNASIKCEWTVNNGLRSYQICPGVVQHPRTGEMVFFNQVQLHHVSFLEPEVRESMLSLFKMEDLPRNVYYGDGSPIEDSVMQDIAKVYWETAVSFPWQEGDILMLDNMLTAHARNPFKGERKIVVALAELMAVTDISNC